MYFLHVNESGHVLLHSILWMVGFTSTKPKHFHHRFYVLCNDVLTKSTVNLECPISHMMKMIT